MVMDSMANLKAREDDAVLPAALRSDAREKEKERALLSLRKERDAELAALVEKINTPEKPISQAGDNAREETPSRRRSLVTEMREKMKKTNPDITPVTLEGFHQKQQAKKVGDKHEKEKAAEILRSFKGLKDDKDYQSYIFAVHPGLGILLLLASKSRKRGADTVLPGGYVKPEELSDAERFCADNDKKIVLAASKIAAARELYDATGMDLRDDLDRLQPAILRTQSEADDLDVQICENNKRFYFFVKITDDDFYTRKKLLEANMATQGYKRPQYEYGQNLMLKLCKEISGYSFEKDIKVVINYLAKHSYGASKEALLMIKEQQGDEINWSEFLSDLQEENGSNEKIQIEFRTPTPIIEENGHNDDDENEDPPKGGGIFGCFFCGGSEKKRDGPVS